MFGSNFQELENIDLRPWLKSVATFYIMKFRIFIQCTVNDIRNPMKSDRNCQAVHCRYSKLMGREEYE